MTADEGDDSRGPETTSHSQSNNTLRNKKDRQEGPSSLHESYRFQVHRPNAVRVRQQMAYSVCMFVYVSETRRGLYREAKMKSTTQRLAETLSPLSEIAVLSVSRKRSPDRYEVTSNLSKKKTTEQEENHEEAPVTRDTPHRMSTHQRNSTERRLIPVRFWQHPALTSPKRPTDTYDTDAPRRWTRQVQCLKAGPVL